MVSVQAKGSQKAEISLHREDELVFKHAVSSMEAHAIAQGVRMVSDQHATAARDVPKIGCINHDCDVCQARPPPEQMAKRPVTNRCPKCVGLSCLCDGSCIKPEQEPVAWFAFADHNGPVPLELYGWDEKACKHTVLTYARAWDWKGTVEGFLMQQGWTLLPVYTPPPQRQPLTAEQMDDLIPLGTTVALAEVFQWMGRAVEAAHDINTTKD